MKTWSSEGAVAFPIASGLASNARLAVRSGRDSPEERLPRVTREKSAMFELGRLFDHKTTRGHPTIRAVDSADIANFRLFLAERRELGAQCASLDKGG